MDLPLLSIEAAEELQKLRIGQTTDLKNIKELYTLIKNDFTERVDYSMIFKEAYFSTYSKNISDLTREIEEISKRLESPLKLRDNELGELVDFCVNLSDSSAIHQREIEKLKRGGCFI